MKKRIFVVVIVSVMMMMQMIGCTKVSLSEEAPKSNTRQEQVRLEDDYYEYINHSLLDMIDLNNTNSHWDWFNELSAASSTEMRNIIAELKDSNKVYERGSSEQKIRDLYECVSNKENRNAVGLGPLQPHLDRIRKAKNLEEYEEALFYLSGEYGFSSVVGGYLIDQDRVDSKRNRVYLIYADTLIGKEYIENPEMAEYVTMYFDYMADMFQEFGMTEDKAKEESAEIEIMVRELCAATMKKEDYADPAKTYNVFTKEELQQLYTNVDVAKMLKILQIDQEDSYIVMDVLQAKKVNELLTEDNLELLKDFSTFVMLHDAAEYSTEKYASLKESMENKLYGVSSYGDWILDCSMTQDLLPWDFAQIYVEKHFSEKNKKDVENMIPQILEAYEKIIDRQDWMSQETKDKAKKKLETMNVKIGYPDTWPISKDMMQVTPIEEGGSLLSNLLVNMQVNIAYNLQKLGKEVDCEEWGMTPQTVNAYYDVGKNEIVFPAAILQAPFYDSKESFAKNMGGIGYVIAHEVSHAFDASGALYDEYGNYHVWWTEDEMKTYHQLSQKIIDYYDQYEIAGSRVNGSLTLLENIADLGAAACVSSIIGDDKEQLQEMFEKIAYIWASESTVSYQLYALHMDSHAPNKIRVNGVLSASDAFYTAYDIREGDQMYVAPTDRVGIWR